MKHRYKIGARVVGNSTLSILKGYKGTIMDIPHGLYYSIALDQQNVYPGNVLLLAYEIDLL